MPPRSGSESSPSRLDAEYGDVLAGPFPSLPPDPGQRVGVRAVHRYRLAPDASLPPDEAVMESQGELDECCKLVFSRLRRGGGT
jgi:hypothetical protein